MRSILTFILLLGGFSSFAQATASDIKSQAELVANAMRDQQLETIADRTYPAVIDMLGGRDKMIDVLKKGLADLAKQGITFDNTSIGDPGKIFKAGNELHCIVPQTVVLQIPQGKLKSESFLIAISRDNGKFWYFVDGATLTSEQFASIVPDVNPEMKLPAKKEPVLLGK